MQPPDIVYGDLFTDVQTARIFPDSKTFVDCIPRYAPETILDAYRRERLHPGFDLRSFIDQYFAQPISYSTNFRGDPDRPVKEHIRLLWEVLLREADKAESGSSLIPLPYPYVVPGGRFGEIYYWDSYFTMLGLLESGRADIARQMLANFAYLVDTVGHIPNGNRTYFLSRSQPPFFALMVHAVAQHTKENALYATYLSHVRKEYDFWMTSTPPQTALPHADKRVVELTEGAFLNRYWDNVATPRTESYIEDVEVARESGREPQQLYRDLRAACESGWDFSSRWFEDGKHLKTIATTKILPVDLNCLLWSMENFLAECYATQGMLDDQQHFNSLKDERVALIDQYFWDAEKGIYQDYNFAQQKHTGILSPAMLFPLFVGIATQAQADAVAMKTKLLLKPGGLVTTLQHTGQQWDAPNGWAPLQWIAYRGLMNYGHETLARDIAENWINNAIRVYHNTGKLVEKYNVEDITLEAGGGEYPVQDGFGWTNGVLLKLMGVLGKA